MEKLRSRTPAARGVALLTALALSLALAAPALGEVVTNSGEDLRTGWYPNQPSLASGLVTGGTFGQLFSTPVEGQVYAQPLLADGTLLVATEADRVYGIDPTAGTVRWHTTLGTPWNAADIGCGDLTPTIGVTATPVIDTTAGVAYMTHKTYLTGSSGPARWFMDAISLSSGKQVEGFPVELGGSAQNAPAQTFEPTHEMQRPGLLLMNGVVYAAFGSECDYAPWQGWVFGVSIGGAVRARWVADETSNGAGIWQSGAGLTSDEPGAILLATGNGGAPTGPIPGSSPPANLGESVVRLRVQEDGSLKATDFFAPFDAKALDASDADFGSGGLTGLPDEPFGTPALPHLAVAVGKDGYVYLLNRADLGGIGEGPAGSDDVVQRLGPNGGVWSRPGVWPGEGGWVYIPTASPSGSASGSAGNLDVYRYGLSGTGQPALSLAATSAEAFGFSSSAPVITSNGTAPGSALVWIVWAPNGSGAGAQLRAYAPVPVHGEPQLLWHASVGTSSKFAIPGVGQGRLYVGTRDGHVLAFGAPTTPPLSGAGLAFGNVREGGSAQLTATFTANEAVTVDKLELKSAEFTFGASTPALPATLSPGQQLTVPVTFKPTATGLQAASLQAVTATETTAAIGLSGTGEAPAAQLEAAPVVLSFGGVAIGGPPAEQAVTFSNVGGEALTIDEVVLPKAPFAAREAPAVGSQLAPGAFVTIPVSFAPSEPSSLDQGEITLRTTGGKRTIVLTGSAAPPPQLQLGAQTLQFGTVDVGARTTRTFTVANVGGTALRIDKSKPPAGGEFSAGSSEENPLPEGTTLAPGETLTETVTFAPTAPGRASGAWLITGDDGGGVHEVLLDGEGTAAQPATGPPQQQGTSVFGPGVGEQSVLPTHAAAAAAATLSGVSLTADAHAVVLAGVSCPTASPASCRGTLLLRTHTRVPIHAAGTRTRLAVLTLAHADYVVAPGRTATIALRLTEAARALLARARTLRAQALLLATGGAASPTPVAVTIHASHRHTGG